MARKSVFKNRKTISVTLEDEELRALDEIRWRERKERADVGRTAILDYIKAHTEGNDTFKLDNWVAHSDFKAVPAVYSDKLKWRNHYQNSDPQSRTDIRIKFIEIWKEFVNVEFNENSKVKLRSKF